MNIPTFSTPVAPDAVNQAALVLPNLSSLSLSSTSQPTQLVPPSPIAVSAVTATFQTNETGLKGQILTYLSQHPSSTAQDMAKAMYPGQEVEKTKEINSALYKMVYEHKVQKVDQKPVRWSLKTYTVTSNNQQIHVTHDSIKNDVLDALKQKGVGVPVLTKDLVQALPYDRSQVNSALYAMEKQHLVKKDADADGKNPRWSLLTT